MSLVNRSRRLGERLGVHGVVVGWDTAGRRSPRRHRRTFAEADVIDVSVTGAQLLAPTSPRIDIDSVVTIAAGGALGVVRVTRIVPVTNGPLRVFGVEFVELEAPMEALLFAHLDVIARAPESVVWR